MTEQPLTRSEENYLKAVYSLSGNTDKGVSTSDLATRLETKASSVTDMVQKLAEKNLLHYRKYQGAKLTPGGKAAAIQIVRKHRLWEVFLHEKLGFAWDEVHDIAEQLEHIKSEELILRLERFLGHPKYDPHGDPIPDPDGRIQARRSMPVSEMKPGMEGVITGVRDSSSSFLQYLDKQQLVLGTRISVVEVFDYDQSVQIETADNRITLSFDVSKNIKVQVENG